MTLAYLDTNSGIAGDMTLAALVDAGADVTYLRQQVASLGLKDVELEFSETQRHCFRALRLDVHHPPEHAHRHLSDIERMVSGSALTAREREMTVRIFRRLGMAEAKVHGSTLADVHFHEVGAIDSIVDIVGISVALCNLDVSRIWASATPTGCGQIQIAHGIVSVPAPATAELLRGIPIRGSNIKAELTTPTGAAVLATLADGFGPLPDMQISRIGYGAGHRELQEQANVLRIILGQPLSVLDDEVVVLNANLDDATGEQLGFAIEQLWKAGALDVFTTPIGMKKNRPATLLSVICHPQQKDVLEECLFQHTGSLGVRRQSMARRRLHRESIRVPTQFGPLSVKVAWSQDGSARFSPEYEDCRRAAGDHNTALERVFRAALDAAWERSDQLSPPKDITASGIPNPAVHEVSPHEVPPASVPWNPAEPSGDDHHHDHPHDHHHH